MNGPRIFSGSESGYSWKKPTCIPRCSAITTPNTSAMPSQRPTTYSRGVMPVLPTMGMTRSVSSSFTAFPKAVHAKNM